MAVGGPRPAGIMRVLPLATHSVLAQQVVRHHIQQPQWWRPGLGILVLGFFALAGADNLNYGQWWVPGTFIATSGLILLPTMYCALRHEVEQIMADHLLVLSGAFIVYFVIGALLVPFGPRDLAEFVLSRYPIGAPLGMRITAVNCIGFGFALVSGSLVGRKWIYNWAGRAISLGRNISREVAVAVFLLIGGASALYVLPSDIGIRTNLAIGTLRMISMLVYVAIMLAAASKGRGSIFMLGLAISLALIQASVGFLVLNKTSLLFPIAALLAGLSWRYGVRRVMVPGVAVLLGVFILTDQQITRGRQTYGLGNRIAWNERIDEMTKSLVDPGETKVSSEYSGWARFNYLTSQGAAMNLYDFGLGSDDYKQIGWLFLPRIAFSNKPIISSGGEFNYKVTGNEGSSDAPGVFVDGYYNLGWWGVIVVGIIVGCMLAWTSALATMVFRARAFIWMPLAMVGSYMAFRVDGTFLTDYCGSFVLLFYVVFIIGIGYKHFNIKLEKY